MKNRNVGFLIVGIAITIGILIVIFNLSLRNIVSQTCVHGPACTMYATISIQTWVSVAIAVLVLVIGLFLIFSEESERIIIKKVKPYGELKPVKFSKKSLEGLNNEEKRIMNVLLENKGSVFQSEIADKLNLDKVRVTRMLDSLEGKGLIERKRRGMTNIVILRQ